jgi:hypothetical protein
LCCAGEERGRGGTVWRQRGVHAEPGGEEEGDFLPPEEKGSGCQGLRFCPVEDSDIRRMYKKLGWKHWLWRGRMVYMLIFVLGWDFVHLLAVSLYQIDLYLNLSCVKK